MEALGINLGYLIMQVILFIILLLVLKHYMYEPILNALEARKERIAKGLEDARQAAIARDNADAEAKKVLENARAEAAKVRQEATTGAEEQRKGILAQANEEARGVLTNARTEAEGERDRILADLRSQVAAISMAAANKIVSGSMTEERQRALLTDFFSKVPADVAGLSGSTATVTSALPLTDSEKAQVERSIQADNISYKVDPSILGGLVIRVGDQVIDNSVAAQMTAMGNSLV